MKNGYVLYCHDDLRIDWVCYLSEIELNRLETMIDHNEKQFNNLRHEFYIHKHD